jgi:NAD(P)-dependent dehydrogenase (short-subunit alcohol dehydrogenase family)
MMKPQFDLEGKYALITGASGGIGTASARLFARAGARLFVAGTREEKLKSLCAELEGLGARCSFMALDVNGHNAPSRLVDAAVKEMGRLDILVNALGINRPQLPEEVTEENWDAVLNTNLRSVFFICQSAGRQMIKQQYGRIVNISSQAGSVALPLRAAYCASKAGVDMMTRVLAVEWASHNIRVNAVAPTFVETPFVTEMFKDPAFKRYVLDSIPAGRMATTDEVAYAALYLACDLAGIVTGHVLLVDGGWTVK